MVSQRIGLLDLHALEGHFAARREYFRRAWVECQSSAVGALGRGLVVFLLEDAARLVLRGPEALVFLQGIGVEIADQKIELIGKMMVAGVFGRRPADQEQLVRIGDLLVLVGALAVGADEPAEGVVGLGEVAAIALQASQHPAGEQMIRLIIENLLRDLARLVPFAAQVQQLRPPGQEIGVLGQILESGVDGGKRLVVFPFAFVRFTQADGRRPARLGLLDEVAVQLLRLGIIAAQPRLARDLERTAGTNGGKIQPKAEKSEKDWRGRFHDMNRRGNAKVYAGLYRNDGDSQNGWRRSERKPPNSGRLIRQASIPFQPDASRLAHGKQQRVHDFLDLPQESNFPNEERQRKNRRANAADHAKAPKRIERTRTRES